MQFEQMWDLLASIKDQIRAFDAKAQVVTGVNGLLIGFVITEILGVAELSHSGFRWRLTLSLFLAGVSLLMSIVAVCFSMIVIRPRIEFRQPQSQVFYCHLAEKYGSDFGRAAADLVELDGVTLLKDTAGQVQANALVCYIKAKSFRPTFPLTTLAILTFALSVVPYSSMKWEAGHAAQGIQNGPPSKAEPVSLQAPGAITAWPYAIPLATICGAVAGAAVTFAGNRRNAREQNGLASRMKLADFREVWLNRLRETVAELEGEVLSLTKLDPESMKRSFELATRARLFMNNSDPAYKELDALLFALTNNEAADARLKLGTELTSLCQTILKREWETLKHDLEYAPPTSRSSRRVGHP